VARIKQREDESIEEGNTALLRGGNDGRTQLE